jgi:hypothetical protein
LIPPPASETFITFDAPGAINGTEADSINPAGAIAGTYADASNMSHGFLRAPNGTFTTFDPPGKGAFVLGSFSINPAGAITGSYAASNLSHGFLRSPGGGLGRD